MQPFEQLRWDAVPALPRLPHQYFESEARDVEMMSQRFGRMRARVRVFGDEHAPPLLLVHGFMTTSYSWRYVLPRLGAAYRLFIPDLVGCGESDKPDGDYHPEHVATWLGELCDALDLNSVQVVGNSMGGYLCMRLALQRPALIARLVNLHSPGLPTARMSLLTWALRMTPGWRRILRAFVWRNPDRWVHTNVHYFDETLKSKEEHAQYAAPLRTPDGFAGFCHMLHETMGVDAMREFATRLRTTEFPIPLQLVYAERDPLVPSIVGERLAALCPQAEYRVLKDASHFAHVDATDRFLDIAMPFLRGDSGSTSGA